MGMLKNLLLTGILGIFSVTLCAQGINGEFGLYVYSGRYSNPALGGIKEYGTSLGYQVYRHNYPYRYSSSYPLISHQLELGQSLFKGKGGLELQWNHSECTPNFQRNSGALAYSH